MKKILFIISLMSIISCKEKNKTKEVNLVQDKKEVSIVKKSDDQNFYDSKLLNGVWAENIDDNALFEIKNDTLRYVEYYDTPYIAQIVKNKLVIKYLDNKVLSESYILKISKDSLVLKTDDEPSLKLYNRRE